jgi:hypothetical protein
MKHRPTSRRGRRSTRSVLRLLEPVALEKGQEIQVGLHADLVDQDYIWRWETKIPAGANRPALHFQQSTFQGTNLSF